MWFIVSSLFFVCVLFGCLFFLVFIYKKIRGRKAKFSFILSMLFFSFPLGYMIKSSLYDLNMEKEVMGDYINENSFLYIKENFQYETNFGELKDKKGTWKFLYDLDENTDFIVVDDDLYLRYNDTALEFKSHRNMKTTFVRENH